MDEQLALEACQCLWEAVLEKIEAEPSCQFAKFREQYGAIPLRHAMRQQPILEACSSGWKNLTEEQRQALLPLFLDRCLEVSGESIALRSDWEINLKGQILPSKVECEHKAKGTAPLFYPETWYVFSYATELGNPRITLDCRNGCLCSRIDFLDEEGKRYVPNDVRLGHVLEFPVHPRISSEAFNNLIEEISPIAQQVVNGYASVNVKNKYRYYEVESSYTDEAKLARNKIAEI